MRLLITIVPVILFAAETWLPVFLFKHIDTYMKLPEDILTFMPQNSFTTPKNTKEFLQNAAKLQIKLPAWHQRYSSEQEGQLITKPQTLHIIWLDLGNACLWYKLLYMDRKASLARNSPKDLSPSLKTYDLLIPPSQICHGGSDRGNHCVCV